MPLISEHEFFIQLHLTERCNLRCTHCYQTGDRSDELSLPEIQSLITEVAEMLRDWSEAYTLSFASSFSVTGGEPFMRHDLFPVLEELRARGLDTYLLSNGTLIDRDRATGLAKLGVKGVQVSIEGPETVHDAIRGQGSLAASLLGVGHLLDAGVEVTLNTTLSEINAPYFMDVVEMASSLGVQRLGFSRLVPAGRGRSLRSRMLPAGRLEDLYKKIFTLKTNGFSLVTGDPVAAQLKVQTTADAHDPVPTAGCAAGISGLTILPDGTITPCRRLPVPIGNVRKDSLREVWATSEVLHRIRDQARYSGRCGTCRRWSVCRGCRAIAYAQSADNSAGYLAEDPQCFIVPSDERE
jgi:AdoMet-dependent heme synthase